MYAFTPCSVNSLSFTQGDVNTPPTPHFTLSSHSAFLYTLRTAGRTNQGPRTNKGSVIIQLPVPFLCKSISSQTWLGLTHRSQSQKGRVPPIGAQPESSLLSITTYPLSLLPQTHWRSTTTH